jgi:hypothetical protein
MTEKRYKKYKDLIKVAEQYLYDNLHRLKEFNIYEVKDDWMRISSDEIWIHINIMGKIVIGSLVFTGDGIADIAVLDIKTEQRVFGYWYVCITNKTDLKIFFEAFLRNMLNYENPEKYPLKDNEKINNLIEKRDDNLFYSFKKGAYHDFKL